MPTKLDFPSNGFHSRHINFAFSEKSDTFASPIERSILSRASSALATGYRKHTSPDGGIGRRAGLKHQWSNPCRFDPGSGYRSGVSVLPETPLSFKKGSLPIRIAIIGLNSAVRHFPFSKTIFPLKIEPSTSIFTDISTIERHRSILLMNDIAYAICGSTTPLFGTFIISSWLLRAYISSLYLCLMSL